MRHDLDTIYLSDDFTGRKWTTYHEYCCVVDELFNPASFLDLGCAQGFTVDYFARSTLAVGIEGASAPFSLATQLACQCMQVHDLRDPLDLGRQFDLVNCTEVMEHLEPEYEPVLLDTITRHMSHYLIFTAASVYDKAKGTPRQSHWNVQPYKHWELALQDRGLVLNTVMRDRMRVMLKEKKNVYPWWGRDLIVCQTS